MYYLQSKDRVDSVKMNNMVEIVVHLLLINESTFVLNLYVSGNGSDFSRTGLGPNIWDYVIAHMRKLHEKRAMFFWDAAV